MTPTRLLPVIAAAVMVTLAIGLHCGTPEDSHAGTDASSDADDARVADADAFETGRDTACSTPPYNPAPDAIRRTCCSGTVCEGDCTDAGECTCQGFPGGCGSALTCCYNYWPPDAAYPDAAYYTFCKNMCGPGN